MGTVSPRQSPDAPAQVQTGPTSPGVYEIANGNTEDEEQMFSMIKKPRVRYDVEVVTRLIVYMGKPSFHRVWFDMANLSKASA